MHTCTPKYFENFETYLLLTIQGSFLLWIRQCYCKFLSLYSHYTYYFSRSGWRGCIASQRMVSRTNDSCHTSPTLICNDTQVSGIRCARLQTVSIILTNTMKYLLTKLMNNISCFHQKDQLWIEEIKILIQIINNTQYLNYSQSKSTHTW